MKAILKQIMEKYGTYGVDWMGFALSKKNPLTYHHIEKVCDKGEKTIENGAPLSKKAHRFLNFIEVNDSELYDEWNRLFKEINSSENSPTEIHQEKIKTLRKKGKELENKFMKRK